MESDTNADRSHRPNGETSQQALVRPGTRPDVLRWRQVFGGEERQLGAMRRWLASLLPECPARADVLSVANELCSNAIQHTASGQGAWFAVEVTWHRSVVQVAVADCGGHAEPRLIDDPSGEHGRGLLLVQGLAIRTGFTGDERGRLVWAQIAWDDPNPAARAASLDPYQAAVHDGEAALARRFAGVPAWFGRSTLAWWAVAGQNGLVSAPSARELASLLYRLLGTPIPLETRAAHHAASKQHARQGQRPGAACQDVGPVSQRRPGNAGPGARRPGARDDRRNWRPVLAPGW
jgi:hypothetical protein